MAIALGEPSIDLVLKVVDDARPAAMVRRPDAVHAPLGERRATDAKLFSGVYGSARVFEVTDVLLAIAIRQLPGTVNEPL